MQQEVERALSTLARRAVSVVVAGRTDAGVHALQQVCSHRGEPQPVRALNALLPSDVSVLASEAVPDGFDARRDCTSRAYRYRVVTSASRPLWDRGRALWHPRPLDRGRLRECAAVMVGEHDFTAFTPTDTKHVHFRRRIRVARWVERDDLVLFEVEGDAFLRHMVRILVGTMLRGARPEELEVLLAGAPRTAAGPTAAPHGLFFVGAGYRGEPVLR